MIAWNIALLLWSIVFGFRAVRMVERSDRRIGVALAVLMAFTSTVMIVLELA